MSDPGVWQISDMELSVRIASALLIGGLVGLEREWGGHPAGFRTHILVCLGSALIMLLSIYGFGEFAYEFNVRMDPARLAAQVISGIGFLGAGTILRTGLTISGLTTAASLWVVAALGLAVGAGFYKGAALTTILVLISLFVLNKIEKLAFRSEKPAEIDIYMKTAKGDLDKVMDGFEEYGVRITEIATYEMKRDGEDVLHIKAGVQIRKLRSVPLMLSHLRSMDDVMHVALKYRNKRGRKGRKKKGQHPMPFSAETPGELSRRAP